jgi:hypothetical protein
MTTSESMYVSSATSVHVGPFARTSQVAHLMGRLIRHLNDRNIEPAFRFTEAVQIHRTLNALASMLPAEFERSPEQMSTSTALAYGAMVHLYDPYCCAETSHGMRTAEETEMQAIAIPGMRMTAEYILQFSLMLKASMDQNMLGASPLVADCLYGGAATYAWLAYESGNPQMTINMIAITDVLKHLGNRWKNAGMYQHAQYFT